MIQASHIHALHTLLRTHLQTELEINFSNTLKFADLRLNEYQGNIIFHSFTPSSDIDAVNFDCNLYFDIAILNKRTNDDYLGVWQSLHDATQTLASRMRILKKEGLSGTVNGIEIYNAFKVTTPIAPYKMEVQISDDFYQASLLGHFSTRYVGTDFQNLAETF